MTAFPLWGNGLLFLASAALVWGAGTRFDLYLRVLYLYFLGKGAGA